KERRFREDLYFRLAIVRLRLPALRERAGDLPLLATAMCAAVAERLGVQNRGLDPAASASLERHAWPGNLRELENALERALVLAPGTVAGPIAAAELLFLHEAVEGVPERLAREALAHGVTLERLELALLREALREQRGNVSAAARVVGLS